MSYGHTISLRGDKPPEPGPKKPTLVVCRGLPASGKTTWALEWLNVNPAERSRVNRDDLRQSLFGLDAGMLTYEQEKAVTQVQHATIRALLKAGRDVVCDDTNLRARTVRDLQKIARQADATVWFKDFDTPPALCVERDRQRFNAGGRGVGETVIQSFAKRYLKKGELPAPPSATDADEDFGTYTPDTTKTAAWIVDVDGTLAKMNGRGPFDWRRVGEDSPNEPIVKIVNSLESEDWIIVVSGRDGSCRDLTERWLREHGIRFDELFMREAGDQRKDAIVKSEIFWRDIAPNWNVRGVFDDRDQVVRMWRGLGLTCLQVAPGDF